ncbi:thiolase family protein [Chloroflexota bacterium]
MNIDREAYIIGAVRTPIGSGKESGALHPFSPVELTAIVMKDLVSRVGINPRELDDVIWGVVTPINSQGGNLPRLGVFKAGFPVQIPAVSLNRMCGSSQQALHFAAQSILSGDMDLVMAGGTEMMSHETLGNDYPAKWPDVGVPLIHQGLSAEMMAEKWDINRGSLDEFAFNSHIKAGAAIKAGYFSSQTIPITLPNGKIFSEDQGVRQPPDRKRMEALKPVFKKDGVITAGNASQVSDGAAVILVASQEAVGRFNLVPRARIVGRVVVGSDPTLMLDGPIPATRKILKKTGLKLEDMDIIEINEAFASVVLAWEHEFHPDMSKVNPNGGAIALGHPLGATGAVLMTKLLHELERKKGRYGFQVMCIGHGMATATIIERL